MRWLLVVLLLVSCSTELEPEAAPEPEAIPAATQSPLPIASSTPEPRRYRTIEQVMTALDCTGEVDPVPAEHRETLRGFVACWVGSHNFDIWLIAYGERGWDHVKDAGIPSVSGPGWIVTTPTGNEAASYAHSKLGGVLELLP